MRKLAWAPAGIRESACVRAATGVSGNVGFVSHSQFQLLRSPLVDPSALSFIHSVVHSFIHSVHSSSRWSFIHSLTHSFIPSLTPRPSVMAAPQLTGAALRTLQGQFPCSRSHGAHTEPPLSPPTCVSVCGIGSRVMATFRCRPDEANLRFQGVKSQARAAASPGWRLFAVYYQSSGSLNRTAD